MQNNISSQKMIQFCVPNRQKAIKKTSSGLIGKFTIKKIEFYLRVVFLVNFIFFCFYLSHLETNHFSYRGSVNDKSHLQSNEAQRTKDSFQGIAHVFDSEFL